ncbi:DUF1338 domain-containing protein [Marinomonas ostreistagni]|uniref:DUF1338 domain-containing protein n=1 Tax=Marinomonas ostreistagni TaxID=359209 RepID=UPI00194E271D|nr:DUF1338 domain-containing protein [Marinomonas ostreistagni]MBM6552264.1 DUF1338 domain-containing protein [Marinomonas ostreistagni]
MQIEHFFQSLWSAYINVTPQAQRIKSLFESLNESVINDHVAFRTFADSPIALAKLEPILNDLGYQAYGVFTFATKHLNARCYKHPAPEAPKIFLSELRWHELAPECQNVIQQLIAKIPTNIVQGPEIFWQQRLWPAPTLSDYQILQQHSEYAAWLSTMGMQANHFTVSVNHLKSFASLEAVNQRLQQEGFVLNSSGGLIKGSPELYLEQSSTMADKICFNFADDQKQNIPSCFYEFALRYPQADGTLFDSFIEGNADKIFDSTNH